ncbi:hypothetical protein RYA05_07520 [Pseudomonas syringae pv. actinidiae]|uniref:hypothetical protein n=1 Tax=Pseudomonas syringae TaxID=317 RepID=UPI0002FE1E52|nr:hypothetical protein [Pseudomonas syringae]AQL40473.1 hypothetical protein JN853_08695 [Pseudomonas syringae pv. actinidiae ICMP 9853]EPN65804.1 hypothetical protein A234_33449 [Pseudomonas syringae pv. actinidiae ICMP 19101]EPN72957.1 hypothetical protein A235_01424 [Pseudomonas syringae pv. actinidiae ICMP 19079]AKT29329.1 hypothetical protein IYO_007330 [Pseudomonas syringae pv. actinidiae ICMP 18884]AOE55820.1 hypothetical protein NZ708_07320 [Pseudomonas syringae pv. actinidiae ICMP 18
MNGKLCAASIERAKSSADKTHAMRHARPLIVLPVSLTLLCMLACFTTNDSTLWFEKPAKFAT